MLGFAALHDLMRPSCLLYLPWNYVFTSFCFSSSDFQKVNGGARAPLAVLGLDDQVVGAPAGTAWEQGPRGRAPPLGPLHTQAGRVAGGRRQPGSCFAHVPTQAQALLTPGTGGAGFPLSAWLEEGLLGGC